MTLFGMWCFVDRVCVEEDRPGAGGVLEERMDWRGDVNDVNGRTSRSVLASWLSVATPL